MRYSEEQLNKTLQAILINGIGTALRALAVAMRHNAVVAAPTSDVEVPPTVSEPGR
jgi:hypothetical protein